MAIMDVNGCWMVVDGAQSGIAQMAIGQPLFPCAAGVPTGIAHHCSFKRWLSLCL